MARARPHRGAGMRILSKRVLLTRPGRGGAELGPLQTGAAQEQDQVVGVVQLALVGSVRS